MPAVRAAALGGVIGPVAFIGAWVAGSARLEGYSVVDDAISRLAASGADTRPLMTAGFVAFGVGLPVYAVALRHVLGGAAWVTAAATGVATLAVAVLPLERSAAVDRWHAVAAAIGYVTLAATPLVARRSLRRRGHDGLAGLGLVCGAVSAAALVASASGGVPTGLFQRIGLTAGDVWVMASAGAIASGRLVPDRRPAAHRGIRAGPGVARRSARPLGRRVPLRERPRSTIAAHRHHAA